MVGRNGSNKSQKGGMHPAIVHVQVDDQLAGGLFPTARRRQGRLAVCDQLSEFVSRRSQPDERLRSSTPMDAKMSNKNQRLLAGNTSDAPDSELVP